MEANIWLAYVGTVLVFMLTPGPSHLLMLSNSISNGFNKASATAAGDLSANLLQMLAASLGLVGVLHNAEAAFLVIKWLGVIYLLYMGLKLLVTSRSLLEKSSQRPLSSLYLQGFITSASNPKAVVFFAALFPQFIDANEHLLPQFLVLSLTYLFIDGVFLCAYGKFADTLVGRMKESGRTLNILAGSLFIAAAIMLGFKSIKS
jgi:threonine/homoserine/homoserine lactone efflux protein